MTIRDGRCLPVFLGLAAVINPQGQTFDQSGLAHPRFTDQQGVIFTPPTQGLHYLFQFRLAANQGVNFTSGCSLAEVNGELSQGLSMSVCRRALDFAVLPTVGSGAGISSGEMGPCGGF